MTGVLVFCPSVIGEALAAEKEYPNFDCPDSAVWTDKLAVPMLAMLMAPTCC